MCYLKKKITKKIIKTLWGSQVCLGLKKNNKNVKINLIKMQTENHKFLKFEKMSQYAAVLPCWRRSRQQLCGSWRRATSSSVENKYINVVCYMYVIIVGQSLKLLKKFPKSQFYRLSLGDITFKYHVQSVETSMLP